MCPGKGSFELFKLKRRKCRSVAPLFPPGAGAGVASARAARILAPGIGSGSDVNLAVAHDRTVPAAGILGLCGRVGQRGHVEGRVLLAGAPACGQMGCCQSRLFPDAHDVGQEEGGPGLEDV